MRTYLVILILLFNLQSFAVQASDVILGTIQSVNPEKGELVINIIDTSAKYHEQDQDSENRSETIIVKFEPENTDVSNLSTGKLIRIWGSYDNESLETFNAKSLSQRGMHGRKNDPTGVRSRLGRGRGSFGGGMQNKGRGWH